MSDPGSFEEMSKTLRNVANRQVEALERIAAVEQRLDGALGRLSKIEDRLTRVEKVSGFRNSGYAR